MTFVGRIPAVSGVSGAPSLGGSTVRNVGRGGAGMLDTFSRGISPAAALNLQVRTNNLSIGLRAASAWSAASHQMAIIRNLDQ
jgi:hypothetical protein